MTDEDKETVEWIEQAAKLWDRLHNIDQTIKTLSAERKQVVAKLREGLVQV